MSFQQSVSLPMYYDAFPNHETLAATVAGIGFTGIELWGRGDDFQPWLALARQHGLKLIGMVGHRARLNQPECHATAEAELRESIDIAAEHQIPNLICFGGYRVEGQSDAQAQQAVIEGFRRIVPYAEEKGVNLLMELLNSKVDHPGYLADHTAWGVAVCEAVASPRLRLLFDIYHMQVMEGDLIRTLTTHLPWIGHFHTAGNPGRNEMGPDQEINYAAIARALRQHGYTGYVGHEFKPLGDPVAGLKEAFAIFDRES